jgi:hypothetical protein
LAATVDGAFPQMEAISLPRRLILLLLAIATCLTVLGTPAQADEVQVKCVTRGPVAGETVHVCARLARSWPRAYYAYGGMQYYPASGYPRHSPGPHLYIDALHLRSVISGLTYVEARGAATSGYGHIFQFTNTVEFTSGACSIRRLYAIIGYHIVWSNGQRTPASGQASVATPLYQCN